MKKLIGFTDFVIDKTAELGSYLLLLCMGIIVFDVTARFVFGRPTIFVWDTVLFIMVISIIVASAYNLKTRRHIIMDVIVSKFSHRKQILVEVILGPLQLVLFAVLLYLVIIGAYRSIMVRETLPSLWGPPVYHLRTLMILGPLLLLIQGIIDFVGKVKSYLR
ncbi:MAG: TRAP transporter small permease subunit [Eubacteriales bacterium]